MPLPLPRPWRSRPRAWRGVVVWAVVGAALVVLLLRDGDAQGLAIGYGIALACNVVAFFPGRGLGVESRDGALVIPVSRRRTYAPLAGALALVLGYVGVGGNLVFGLVVWAVVFAAVAYDRGLGGEVRLDPRGVSLPPRHRLAWVDARDVVARRLGCVHVGRKSVRTDRYEADPVLVYWTLHYYATHPESRDELADGRALDRVRRARDEPALLVDAAPVALAR